MHDTPPPFSGRWCCPLHPRACQQSDVRFVAYIFCVRKHEKCVRKRTLSLTHTHSHIHSQFGTTHKSIRMTSCVTREWVDASVCVRVCVCLRACRRGQFCRYIGCVRIFFFSFSVLTRSINTRCCCVPFAIHVTSLKMDTIHVT